MSVRPTMVAHFQNIQIYHAASLYAACIFCLMDTDLSAFSNAQYRKSFALNLLIFAYYAGHNLDFMP